MTATLPTLSTQYDPSVTEQKWQHYWEDKQVFQADPSIDADPYCIVIPPPNVTGSLHMGHAFEHALIDVLVRYHRMKGHNTLWLPGTDHASIAVSTLLDQELQQQGKTRADIGRDAYLKRAWAWKEASGGTIVGQLRKLGLSVDWSRERFTMDAGLSHAVLTAFNRLYDEGLIYRGNYMVNWCPASQSAVSDLEVENKEIEGHLWHFRYPLRDGSGYLEVATTRPETMLGDTAVAVNPEDQRYQHLVGKTLTLPIMERQIPIIADEAVDASFGTGCVKVTPAHDPNDFAMGQRHNLTMITIMNKDGSLNENAGPFQGLDRFQARQAVVDRLQAEGYLVRVEDYHHTVPYSDRGKVPIEPLLSTQWFVKIRPLADSALDFLDNHQSPRFIPERWTKVYRDWLVSLRDWCISRQLWWGHQIPAWYAISETGGELTDATPFIVAMSEEEARAKATEQFGDGVVLQQDPDVLDTWFSSGLWPFSTLGWPDENHPDFQTYYPTTTLVTGFDIIFFWVARMTMMAGHFTNTMPFETVYIHGLVRDENNKKMSKSARNGIDPLLLIEKYGTDALRYTLIREVAGAGQDIRLEYNRKTDESPSVEASRNFTNKLWNAARFVLLNLDGETPQSLGAPEPETIELCDRWILSRFHRVISSVRTDLDNYGLGEAAKELYEFVWGDFCDWYIELVKPRLQQAGVSKRTAQQTLAHVLDGILKLLHPFVPHITEEVWHTLNQAGEEDCLALQPYPEAVPTLIDDTLEQQFQLLIGTVRTIRNLRAEAGIKPSAQIETMLQSGNPEERHVLQATQTYIQQLGRIETLLIEADSTRSTATTAAKGSKSASEGGGRHAEIGSVSITAAWQAIQSWLHEPWAYLRQWTQDIKRPAITLLLVFVLLLTLRVLAAIAEAIESTPLLASTMRLIGMGYSIWFIGYYLLTRERRQQLWRHLETWRQEIVGPGSSPPPSTATELASEEPISRQKASPQRKLFAGVVGTVQVLIPLSGIVDVEALRLKLEKDLNKVDRERQSLRQRLSNPNFVEKAPDEVVQGARQALAETEKQATILRQRLARL